MNTPLFTLARTPVTLTTLVVFGLIVLATFWVSRLARQAVRRGFALRKIDDVGTIGIATRLVHYAVVLLGMGIGLQTLGVDLGALVAAGAFFAVAIGFAMQNVAQNFVSGIILLTERTIKPGDVLEVDGRVVRVSRLGLRSTVARTRDEEDLIIPNSALVQNTVTNFTLGDPLYRLRTKVGVSYGSDMSEVIRVLADAAATLPERVDTYEPRVLLTDFGDSSVNFDVSIWIRKPWDAKVTLSALNEAIWWALKDARIAIPFPQRDVHIMTQSAMEEMSGMERDTAS
ncbi:MAG: mechanosensitive ion channel domain-containing protein [Gemmatimonadaceae bacterium]